jgi:hypothetical protein
MNAKSSSLKLSLLIAAALPAGGCSTVPAGYGVAVEADHVIWEAVGRPKLVRLPQSPAVSQQTVATTGEFPGHPIHGVWSAPMTVAEEPAYVGVSAAEAAFLRELARSDGDYAGGPVETPSETAVASR